MPKTIKTDDLKPGMLLLEAVTNARGQTLLNIGTEILEKHIKFLKMWGIDSVKVGLEEDEQSDDEEIDIDSIPDELIDKAKSKLFGKMRWTPANAYEKDLLMLGVFHLARGAKGEANE